LKFKTRLERKILK